MLNDGTITAYTHELWFLSTDLLLQSIWTLLRYLKHKVGTYSVCNQFTMCRVQASRSGLHGIAPTNLSEDCASVIGQFLASPTFSRGGHLLCTANSDSVQRSQFRCRTSKALEQYTNVLARFIHNVCWKLTVWGCWNGRTSVSTFIVYKLTYLLTIKHECLPCRFLEKKMRHPGCYPIPFNRTKRYQSFVHYALSWYQFK